jgi:hypothetical protein
MKKKAAALVPHDVIVYHDSAYVCKFFGKNLNSRAAKFTGRRE